jgi:hypothetical protein
MTHPPLTLHVATQIAEIGSSIGKRVSWAADDGATLVGTLRGFTTPAGFFPPRNYDIRDAAVWITTRSGFELFMPVADALERLEWGGIALDYDAGA